MVAPIVAAAGVAVPGIVDSIMRGIGNLFTTDKEREEAKLILLREMNQPHILQALTNIEGAKHSSIFVAGWRPFIGWVCGFGLAYAFLIFPFAELITFYLGYPGQLPPMDTSILLPMTMNLLGLGGLRTYEKMQGVARESDPKRK